MPDEVIIAVCIFLAGMLFCVMLFKISESSMLETDARKASFFCETRGYECGVPEGKMFRCYENGRFIDFEVPT